MKKLPHILGITNIIAISLLYIDILNTKFPLVGHDFHLWMPYLYSGKWHFFRAGLFPLRFSPWMCGGAPVYGLPYDFQYSFLQFLVFLFTPWIAVNITVFLCVAIGYVGWFLFARRVLTLNTIWAHVLAVIVLSNGFLIMHLLVAHYWIFSFFFIGWILWLLFENRISDYFVYATRVSIFALIVGMTLFFAGFNALLFTTIGIILFSPIYFLLVTALQGKNGLKIAAIRWIIFGFAAIALSASKLVAVYLYMSHFPRLVDVWSLDIDIFEYIAKAFWAYPQNNAVFRNVSWQLHEKSMYLSWWVIPGVGMAIFSANIRSFIKKNPRLSIAIVAYAFIAIFIATELVRGTGWFADWMYSLPLFSSVRVSLRFAYIISVPIIIIGVEGLAMFSAGRKKAVHLGFAFLVIITTLFLAYAVHKTAVHQLPIQSDYRVIASQWIRAHARGFPRYAQPVVMTHEPDFVVAAGIDCTDELLRAGGNKHRRFLNEGPILQEGNGRLNMINPSCYQYPNENDCNNTVESFFSEDKEKLERFLSGDTNFYELSSAQKIADAVSITALICFSLILIITPIIQQKIKVPFIQKRR